MRSWANSTFNCGGLIESSSPLGAMVGSALMNAAERFLRQVVGLVVAHEGAYQRPHPTPVSLHQFGEGGFIPARGGLHQFVIASDVSGHEKFLSLQLT
jgi:hypothetical protein